MEIAKCNKYGNFMLRKGRLLRICSLLLALVLVICPAAPAFAASSTAVSGLQAGDLVEPESVERAGIGGYFTQTYINDRLFQRIYKKSYKEDCTVPRGDLRYLRVLHYDFSGNIRVGEIICNKSISDDLLSIFKKLYQAKYPIEKILLVDDYGADDEVSSGDNNTSCFNYRKVPESESMSLHAYGMAIDINPLYNPYIMRDASGTVTCSPANGAEYMDRSQEIPHKIDSKDLCVKLFKEAGFTWGGDWQNEPDYMHFSRGSRPKTE